MSLSLLPNLLLIAWLLPLASFVLILFFGPRMGKAGKGAGMVATGAILSSAILSWIALLAVWLPNEGVSAPGGGHEEHAQHTSLHPQATDSPSPLRLVAHETEHTDDAHAHAAHPVHVPTAVSGDWYTLGQFGSLKITIGYYIDALTVLMFAMVTFIATCIHFYATGYMHDELHDVTDREVLIKTKPPGHGHHGHKIYEHNRTVNNHDDHGHDDHGHEGHGHGDHGHDAHGHASHPAPPEGMEYLHRPGRFSRFFQYLSLFCFSMLGIVIAGNIAMVFVFWELVGICSYFLIGFYVERKSASTAANKAFIVNRVGDFGMIIGLMALFATLGTFSFGDSVGADGQIQRGIFSQVHPPENDYQLTVPDGMIRAVAESEIATIVREHLPAGDAAAAESEIASRIDGWRSDYSEGGYGRYAYWLLVIAGIGIFCGCVGKSAQFPLHVWLPDAMEGPTPVSALVHSATMVAAGVYLVGRFYPVFTPEVLLVIGVIGGITLFVAATIAITATDIKRVLAYSTVSQLGYMMLSLGVGGWVGGMFHLFTHAFFKSLLFMCSGSVIHATHTNEMPKMGGLRHKMPWTAYTMLAGCLAIAGFGIPFVIGTSGYYSKDAMLAQAFSFRASNSAWHGALVYVLCAGAFLTAFYMFRLWFMTFAGQPRDQHIYDHAHESPKVMYYPLVVLAVMAVIVGWGYESPYLTNLLEQARPAGTGLAIDGRLLPELHHPAEHDSHAATFHNTATLAAFGTAMGGILLAVLFYGTKALSPAEVARQFQPIYRFLRNKWYFDELYDAIFVQPTFFVSRRIADLDRKIIDGLINSLAKVTRILSLINDLIDRYIVDGIINWFARRTFDTGIWLKNVQTGNLRQYVMFIVVGTVTLFVLISYFLNYAVAG